MKNIPPRLQITSSFDALDTHLHSLAHDIEAAHTVMHALAETRHPKGSAAGHVALTFLDAWMERLHQIRASADLVNKGLEALNETAR